MQKGRQYAFKLNEKTYAMRHMISRENITPLLMRITTILAIIMS